MERTLTGSLQPASGAARILVVDDNDDVRDLAAAVLRSDGHDVTSAPNADEALFAIAADSAIGLLLTDIMMPGKLDGWELARWSHFLRPSVPIIYMTGYSKKHPYEEAGPPFGPILPKPWKPAQLLACVRRVLEPS